MSRVPIGGRTTLKKKIITISFPTLLTLFYVVFVYFFITYEWNNGLLVSVYGMSPIDIRKKFLCDFVGSLLIVIVILSITFIQKKPLREIGITLKSHKLVIALLAVYFIMFIVNGDFTAKGFYAAFFYLIIISFSEELVFRGYLFTAIDNELGFWAAAIISGLLFGVVHAFMPSITNGYETTGFIITILSNLFGQGILGGILFAVLYKKSGTIFVPVLIHAMLDYSGVLFS